MVLKAVTFLETEKTKDPDDGEAKQTYGNLPFHRYKVTRNVGIPTLSGYQTTVRNTRMQTDLQHLALE